MIPSKSVKMRSCQVQVVLCQTDLFVSIPIEDANRNAIAYQHPVHVALGHSYCNDQSVGMRIMHPTGVYFNADNVFRLLPGGLSGALIYLVYVPGVGFSLPSHTCHVYCDYFQPRAVHQ